MENRITVSICGTEYTLMAEESPAYMQKVAAMVDTKMSEIMAGGRINRMDAAVLAAMNIADEMLKQQGGTENLRAQLKGYLDDISRLRVEINEVRRENAKLRDREKEKEKEVTDIQDFHLKRWKKGGKTTLKQLINNRNRLESTFPSVPFFVYCFCRTFAAQNQRIHETKNHDIGSACHFVHLLDGRLWLETLRRVFR